MIIFHLTNNQKGISIVELLVGMVIGLSLVGAATAVMVSSKVSFVIQNDLDEIQEAGRFAISWLQSDLREAGFMGCVGTGDFVENQVTDGDVASELKDLDNIIEGREKGGSTWQTANTNWLPGNQANLDETIVALSGVTEIENGTDAFTIRGFDFVGFGVVNDVISSATSITLEVDAGLLTDQIVAIINCAGGTVFQVANDTTDATVNINASDALTREFEGEHLDSGGNSLTPRQFPSFLHTYHTYRYYVRPFDANNNPSGPSLWRVSLSSSGLPINAEVIPGVENMQILYGEDTGGSSSPEIYRTANNVGNWNAVNSIKIGLLIRSINAYGNDDVPTSFQLLDETITTVNDRRRRKVFVTEIAIRNRQ